RTPHRAILHGGARRAAPPCVQHDSADTGLMYRTLVALNTDWRTGYSLATPRRWRCIARVRLARPRRGRSGVAGKQEIHLTVNGEPYDLDVAPNRLLVDAIRYDLGLTGTKEGCGIGV